MFQTDSSNTVFSLATDLVAETFQHVFLTGKAGTGKTTFLRHIRGHTSKNCITVAPTGVAAINAGGVTMHSFFQLPRGVFIPGNRGRQEQGSSIEITDRHGLFRNIHFNSNKRKLIQELELLIIDEVSMMRCDMLDAMDVILRHFRKQPHLPFGGVQVLYIGDMFQLPPVVMQEEWKILEEYYASPFFFDAMVIREAPPVYLELKKIYRQNEAEFIEVLNRIRNNVLTPSDFSFLNKKYDPDFIPPPDQGYITLTTHNRKADEINANQLSRLPGQLFSFEANIKDEFGDKAFPTDRELKLKAGAQVMFIKNDVGADRKYFNGKLAKVSEISMDSIFVSFQDGTGDLKLEKETWRNLRYTYNADNDAIDEEELGSFTQYPIRLAWAITVHKSQGLTFEKAVIDAGASFAPGQVYVALSRCVSLEGLVLRSKILPHSISMDRRILQFTEKDVLDETALHALLEKERYRYWSQQLVKIFDWSALLALMHEWIQKIPETKLPDVASVLTLAKKVRASALEQSNVAKKFQHQLSPILEQTELTRNTDLLKERLEKAFVFFTANVQNEILLPLKEHLESLRYTSRVSSYKELVKMVESGAMNQLKRFSKARYGDVVFNCPEPVLTFQVGQEDSGRPKSKKTPTKELTYQLFRKGHSIKDIAALRNLAISTVEQHLSTLVTEGQVLASELLSPEKFDIIFKVVETMGDQNLTSIKNSLGDDISYNEIRVVINHCQFHKRKSA